LTRLWGNALRFAISPYATPLKRWNAAKALWAWRFARNPKVRHYPHTLVVCPGVVCNLRCPLCPTGQGAQGRSHGMMEMACFRKVLDECGPYLFALELYSWGEPFLNPHLFDMVRYAKGFNIEVRISTTLNRFDEHICREIVAAGIDSLTVSLYGASQESVGKYHIGMDFSATLANLEALVKRKKALGRSKPAIRWLFLPTAYNTHEIEEALSISRGLGIDEFFAFPRFRCDMGKELLMSPGEQYDNVSSWLPEQDDLSFYSRKDRRRKFAPESCKWLWTRSAINWNGSVSPCDAVWEERFDFGNIFDGSFFEIWNGPAYHAARRLTLMRGEEQPDSICAICHKNGAILEW
jgi:radical SAM protein with 4Fe4S-binding SPASM domain